MSKYFIYSAFFLILGCKKPQKTYDIQKTVTATAYNSMKNQTKQGNAFLTAWGDTLVPGEKAIAVSRDLIREGLNHNSKVKIEGFEGFYIVKDKMNKRWENRIDIYMGLDKEAALEWGKQKVTIKFDTIN